MPLRRFAAGVASLKAKRKPGGSPPAAPAPAPSSPSWAARSTAAGVVWAHKPDTQSEIDAFDTNPTPGTGHAGDVVKPFLVTDPLVGTAMRFISLGGRLAADFPASGGVGPRSLVLEDDYLWPDPAATNPATGSAYGSYYVHLCQPTGGQVNNLLLVTAKSGKTLTVTYIPESGQPFSTTQRDWVIGDHIGHQSGSNWTRMFSALTGDSNGRGVDDINNAGVTLRSRNNQTSFPHGAQAFGYGWYGRAEYQSEHSTWRPSDHGGNGIDSILRSNLWDGTRFCLSFRYKVDPTFHTLATAIDSSSEDGRFGRKAWMLQAEMTVPQQITGGYSPSNRYWIPSTPEPPFSMSAYSFSGALAGRRLSASLDGSGTYQPGSAWASTALPQSFLSTGSAYEVPAGEWVALHLDVTPGLQWSRDNLSATGVRNTAVEAKMARHGAEAWTTVFSMTDQAIVYGSSGPEEDVWTSALPGYNAISLTGYLNVDLGNVPPKRSYYMDFCDVVFGIIPHNPPVSLPDWVPDAGRVGVLSVANGELTNSFASQVADHYEPFYSKKIVNDYCGTVVNPFLGQYGSIVMAGAGHSASNDNSVILLELEQEGATFRRVVTGSNINPGDTSLNDQGDVAISDDWGEYPDGSPASWHSYGDQVVIPPGVGGAAAYGTFFRCFMQSAGDAGETVGELPHKVDFSASTGEMAWERAGSAGVVTGGVSNYNTAPCWTEYVEHQQRIYKEVRGRASPPIRWFDLTTQTFVSGTGTARTDDGDTTNGGMLFYVPVRKLLIFADRYLGNLRIKTMDVSVSEPSWTNTARTLSATIPIASEWSAACWCPDNNRILIGHVSGDADCVYEIEIPTTLTSTWTCTRVPFTNGDVIPWNTGGAEYKKWSYNPRTRSIIYYPFASDSGADAVYVYRPRNT